MIRAFLLLAGIYFFFTSCKPSPDKHDFILPDEKMAQLMLDLHFADAILIPLTTEQKDSIKQVYWQRLEELYDLSEEEIMNEVRKLEEDPEKMKMIMGRVKQMADSLQ